MKEWLKRLLWDEDPREAERQARLRRAYRAARFMRPEVAAQIYAIHEASERARKEEKRRRKEERRKPKGE